MGARNSVILVLAVVCLAVFRPRWDSDFDVVKFMITKQDAYGNHFQFTLLENAEYIFLADGGLISYVHRKMGPFIIETRCAIYDKDGQLKLEGRGIGDKCDFPEK